MDEVLVSLVNIHEALGALEEHISQTAEKDISIISVKIVKANLYLMHRELKRTIEIIEKE